MKLTIRKLKDKKHSGIKKGISVYKTWHNRPGVEVDKVKKVKFDLSGEGKNPVLAELGRVHSIIYISDKFKGYDRKYIHRFKKQPLMLGNLKKDTLILAPVKFNYRGIIS